MIFSRLATVAAFFSYALAQGTPLQVTSPGSNIWWVAKSNNVLAWNCKDAPTPAQFTVLIANKDQNVLTAPIAIIGIEDNYQCSQLITQDQSNQPAALGYTIILADTLNNTNVYATSQEFEIKALGSAYPTTSTSGGASPTNGTGTSSGSTATSTKSGAEKVVMSVGTALAAMGMVFGLVVG